jgi:hypothetical protein
MQVQESEGEFAGAQRVEGDPNPSNNGIFYFLSDHLGSTTVTVDADGEPVGELRYRAASRSAAEGPLLRGDPLRRRRAGDGLSVYWASGAKRDRAVLLSGAVV